MADKLMYIPNNNTLNDNPLTEVYIQKLKVLDYLNEPTNQNSIKVPKVC